MKWCQLNQLDRYIDDLATQYGPRLCRLALKRIGDRDEAEDIVQRAMLRLYEMLRRHPDKQISNPYGYLCQIVNNLCHDILNERKENPTVPLSSLQKKRIKENQEAELFDIEDISPNHQPQIVAESIEVKKKIEEELSKFTNCGMRRTIELHLNGYSTAEISKELQQPDGTTRGYRSKGLLYLRTRLTDEEDNGQSLDNNCTD